MVFHDSFIEQIAINKSQIYKIQDDDNTMMDCLFPGIMNLVLEGKYTAALEKINQINIEQLDAIKRNQYIVFQADILTYLNQFKESKRHLENYAKLFTDTSVQNSSIKQVNAYISYRAVRFQVNLNLLGYENVEDEFDSLLDLKNQIDIRGNVSMFAMSKFLYMIALYYHQTKHYEKALEYYHGSMNVFNRDIRIKLCNEVLWARTLNIDQLALLHYQNGHLKQSEIYAVESRNIWEKFGNKRKELAAEAFLSEIRDKQDS